MSATRSYRCAIIVQGARVLLGAGCGIRSLRNIRVSRVKTAVGPIRLNNKYTHLVHVRQSDSDAGAGDHRSAAVVGVVVGPLGAAACARVSTMSGRDLVY